MYNKANTPYKECAKIVKTESKSGGSFAKKLVTAFRKSVIISALDKFCLWIYSLLGSGLFARIFTTDANKSDPSDSSPKNGRISKTRRWLSSHIEDSRVLAGITSAASSLISCRLRVIGAYLMTFSVYSLLSAAISLIICDTVAARYDAYVLLVEAATVGALSVPFLASRKTVSKAIFSSRICTKIVDICGFSQNKLRTDDVTGKYSVAFVFGLICGIATLVVSPLYIFAALFAAAGAYIILALPEFGVVCLFLLAPLAPTSALIVLVALVAFAFLMKIIRAKRVFNFKKVDLFVAALAVLLAFGGVVSFSSDSLIPAFMYVSFIVGYFLVSCCMRSSAWLHRCMCAAVWAGLIVAFYGILQYVFAGTMVSAWLDDELFEGISGRAVSTLENPNMLGEYLIMILPMALSVWISGKGMSRRHSFVSFILLGMCLILTWSRGAWLGFIFALIAFLLIWNRRSMWLIVLGAASVPFLPFILPDTIVSRFTSIGNLADSSTSYRVNIWRGAMHMAKDYLFTGIGVGEGPWKVIYPNYTLPGIEAAPHSHNLFIQITLEMGIFGILFFLIAIFLLAKLAFSLISRLGREDTSTLEKNYATNAKLAIAGPLCGLLAVLIQGLTDNSWYNYRVYLMFWLMLGLIPAFVKSISSTLDQAHFSALPSIDSTDEASADIRITDNSKTRKEQAHD